MGIRTSRLALPVVLAALMAGLLCPTQGVKWRRGSTVADPPRRLRDPRGEAGLVGLRVGAGEGDA